MNQTAPDAPGDSAPEPHVALVLVRGEAGAGVARKQLEAKLPGWSVAVRALADDNSEASASAEDAVGELEPAIVVFVGAALAAADEGVGEVLVADYVAGRYRRSGRRSPARRSTRRADPDLVQHASAVREAGRWRERAGTDACAQLGSLVTGSEAVKAYKKEGRAALERDFEGSLALDPSGWDFTSGLYDDVDLPAIAVFGLCRAEAFGEGGNRAELDQAVDWAAAFVAELLASVPPEALHADPLGTIAHEGVSEHLRGDTEVLPLRRPHSFFQRPFLDSAVARDARGQYAGTTKEKMGSGKLDALFETAGSEKRAVLPANLSIGVSLEGKTLSFELNSDDDHYHRDSGGRKELSGEFGKTPEDYLSALKSRIREIAEAPDKSDPGDLRRLGNRLYDDLFPDELKEKYRRFRKTTKTLLISSDEPWIPWELVRPWGKDLEGEDFDDEFLCTQFAMTRWLRGMGPLHRFEVASLASLEAGTVEGEDTLASAKDECDYLIGLAKGRKVDDLSPESSNFQAVMTLLERGAEIYLWHVAAHGRLDRDDPNDSYIVLAGRPWRANDLTGPNMLKVQAARPLVFFNACLVAQQGLALGSLGGWPAQWIRQGQCGGFVGPQWSVSSNLAAVFARAFYDAVVGEQQTLGEAARTARRAVREEAPLDPAWLSYAVYGHPNAEVVFGNGQSKS